MTSWRRWATFGLTVGRSLTHDLGKTLAEALVPRPCQERLRAALAPVLRGIAAGQVVALRSFLDPQGAEAAAGWACARPPPPFFLPSLSIPRWMTHHPG